MKNGWYQTTDPDGTIDFECVIDDAVDYGNGATTMQMLEWGYAFEPAVVMSAYAFNKNMQDAYNIGKHGPIECALEDLLYET